MKSRRRKCDLSLRSTALVLHCKDILLKVVIYTFFSCKYLLGRGCVSILLPWWNDCYSSDSGHAPPLAQKRSDPLVSEVENVCLLSWRPGGKGIYPPIKILDCQLFLSFLILQNYLADYLCRGCVFIFLPWWNDYYSSDSGHAPPLARKRSDPLVSEVENFWLLSQGPGGEGIFPPIKILDCQFFVMFDGAKLLSQFLWQGLSIYIIALLKWL